MRSRWRWLGLLALSSSCIAQSAVSAANPVEANAALRCSADLLCVAVVSVDDSAEIALELDVRTDKPLSFALLFSQNLARLNTGVRQFEGRHTERLLSFEPPGTPWGFYYRIHYGHQPAVHDEAAVYLLPYAVDRAYLITQSHTHLSTHGEANRYAIDWDMPVGEPVHAAREGVVVSTYAESTAHSEQGEARANHIWVRHPDGTIGKYLHLDHGGVLVEEGQRVCAGERIGRSGNTGYSSGAHLHFSVSTLGGPRLYRTFDVIFATADGPQHLTGGRVYRRPSVMTSDGKGATMAPCRR